MDYTATEEVYSLFRCFLMIAGFKNFSIFQTLKLNHRARSETSEGKIVNLSSTDALRYDIVGGFAVC